MTAETGKCRR